MIFVSRERCRTIWLQRVTWRRSAWVVSSAIQTSGKKAAGIELGQYPGIDLIGLDLGMRNQPDLLRIGDNYPTDVRSDYRGHRSRIAGGFDDDNVALDSCLANSSSGSRRMMTRPRRLSSPSFQAIASAKARR